MAVRGVPNLEATRRALLSKAAPLAKLPKDKLLEMETPPYFAQGWSHGKEKFNDKYGAFIREMEISSRSFMRGVIHIRKTFPPLPCGKSELPRHSKGASLLPILPNPTRKFADFAKGSFYANSKLNPDGALTEELKKEQPVMGAPNKWPTKDIPELEPAFMAACEMFADVGRMLAKHMDKTCTKHLGADNYCGDALEKSTFDQSRLHIGRLLHYFPPRQHPEDGDWCGWHNDNSTITGLMSPLLLNDDNGEEVDPTTLPDVGGGLHVVSRNSDDSDELTELRVKIPRDCIGFQLGEAAQILTGGFLVATPHAVKSGARHEMTEHISREQFAIFMEPDFYDNMMPPKNRNDVATIVKDSIEHPAVPPLRKRYGVPEFEGGGKGTFCEFLTNSFAVYYSHQNSNSK